MRVASVLGALGIVGAICAAVVLAQEKDPAVRPELLR